MKTIIKLLSYYYSKDYTLLYFLFSTELFLMLPFPVGPPLQFIDESQLYTIVYKILEKTRLSLNQEDWRWKGQNINWKLQNEF